MLRTACSFAVASIALGCGKSPEAEPAPPAKPPEDLSTLSEPFVVDGGTYSVAPNLKVPEAWVECRIGTECVALEGGCCDHCNGGVLTSVNAQYVEKLRPYIERYGCEGHEACTEIACDPPTDHEIVCMTRACIIVDVEPAVRKAMWGHD